MNDIEKLRKSIDHSFNLAELRILCRDLPIEYEDLSGETKQEKIIQLIDMCIRNNLLEKLKTCLDERRSH